MDPADFGRTEDWCPRLYGAPPDSPCLYPTIRQLLNMGSGMLGIDNCDYPEVAWQREYGTTIDKVRVCIGVGWGQGGRGGGGVDQLVGAVGAGWKG